MENSQKNVENLRKILVKTVKTSRNLAFSVEFPENSAVSSIYPLPRVRQNALFVGKYVEIVEKNVAKL